MHDAWIDETALRMARLCMTEIPKDEDEARQAQDMATVQVSLIEALLKITRRRDGLGLEGIGDSILRLQGEIAELKQLVPIGGTCEAFPNSSQAGDPCTLVATASNLDPTLTTRFEWVTDGGKITGASNVANVDTLGLAPGVYTVHCHIEQGFNPWEMTDVSASFTIVPRAQAK